MAVVQAMKVVPWSAISPLLFVSILLSAKMSFTCCLIPCPNVIQVLGERVLSNETLPPTVVLSEQQTDLGCGNDPRELPYQANVSSGELPVLEGEKTEGPRVEC